MSIKADITGCAIAAGLVWAATAPMVGCERADLELHVEPPMVEQGQTVAVDFVLNTDQMAVYVRMPEQPGLDWLTCSPPPGLGRDYTDDPDGDPAWLSVQPPIGAVIKHCIIRVANDAPPGVYVLEPSYAASPDPDDLSQPRALNVEPATFAIQEPTNVQ